MRYGLSILLLMTCISLRAQTPVETTLISKIDFQPQYQMWDGEPVYLMGYSYLIGAPLVLPSPTLEFNEGDSVNLHMWNLSQGPPHTIHLHGLDVDQANDGVPALSFDVAHDDTGTYHFRAPHAGTYLYHCHVVSPVHVQAGMYGMIIIHPSDGSNTTWDGGYPYDSDVAWLTSEVDTVWHSEHVIDHEHNDSIMVHPVPTTFHPQYFLVNGKSENQLDVDGIKVSASQNEVVYLRLANIGYCGNRIIFPAALNAQIVSSDGRPLPAVENSDTVDMMPGERFGVLLQANSQFTDDIAIEYFNLNTEEVKNTQLVPVEIEGVFGTAEQFIKEEALTLYPNPTVDQLFVSFEVASDFEGQMSIIDMQGRKVYERQVNYSSGVVNEVIDVSKLSSGAYTLNITTPESSINKQFLVSFK